MGTITPITLPKRLPVAACGNISVPAAAFSPVFRDVFRINPEFATLLRGPEESILHSKADRFIHPNYLDKFLNVLSKARPCCGTELVFLHSSGATRPIPTGIARFKDGYLMRIFADRADLTLDGSVTMQEIGAGIAHDTNNALTALLGSADIMGEQVGTLRRFLEKLAKTPDETTFGDALKDLPAANTALGYISEDLANILASTGHLLSILRGFSSFCSGTSGTGNNERFAVSDAIRSSIAISKGIIGRISKDRGIRINLSFDMPDTPLNARGNSDGLQRIVLNLIKNAALEFKDRDNSIRVECSSTQNAAQERFVVIKVKDSGAPIPKPIADRLFREKVGSTHGGSGIGLLTCARMVHDFGGEIRYQSIPDKCFVITLRAAEN